MNVYLLFWRNKVEAEDGIALREGIENIDNFIKKVSSENEIYGYVARFNGIEDSKLNNLQDFLTKKGITSEITANREFDEGGIFNINSIKWNNIKLEVIRSSFYNEKTRQESGEIYIDIRGTKKEDLAHFKKFVLLLTEFLEA